MGERCSTPFPPADNSEDRSPLNHTCIATYIPQTVSYDLSISWTVTDVDERVLDVIRDYKLSMFPDDPILDHLFTETEVVGQKV